MPDVDKVEFRARLIAAAVTGHDDVDILVYPEHLAIARVHGGFCIPPDPHLIRPLWTFYRGAAEKMLEANENG